MSLAKARPSSALPAPTERMLSSEPAVASAEALMPSMS